jgi:hypothetical protein
MGQDESQDTDWQEEYGYLSVQHSYAERYELWNRTANNYTSRVAKDGINIKIPQNLGGFKGLGDRVQSIFVEIDPKWLTKVNFPLSSFSTVCGLQMSTVQSPPHGPALKSQMVAVSLTETLWF